MWQGCQAPGVQTFRHCKIVVLCKVLPHWKHKYLHSYLRFVFNVHAHRCTCLQHSGSCGLQQVEVSVCVLFAQCCVLLGRADQFGFASVFRVIHFLRVANDSHCKSLGSDILILQQNFQLKVSVVDAPSLQNKDCVGYVQQICHTLLHATHVCAELGCGFLQVTHRFGCCLSWF